MKPGPCARASFVVGAILVLGSCAWSFADDSELPHQLTLADLTAYRTALAGKPSAGDGDGRGSERPAPVTFKQLWSQPDAFRGRRVTIEGRIERIFRQGPVGSFPALAEIWIASPAGDPFCLVVPQEDHHDSSPGDDHGLEIRVRSKPIPERGTTVRFTGTFLKMVRYASGDGARLAPLIVGDQPPVQPRKTAQGDSRGRHSDDGPKPWAGSAASWMLVLTLALLAAGLLGWRHLHAPSERAGSRNQGRRNMASLAAEPPLEFIEPDHEPGPTAG